METLEELYVRKDFEQIVQRFEKFLGRYREIFSPKTSTRKVIGLAKSSDIRRALTYLTHSGDADQVHKMRMMLIENFGYEELCQVIYLAFLLAINRYDPSKQVPLEKYVYNVYPYWLSIEISKLASPPYNEIRKEFIIPCHDTEFAINDNSRVLSANPQFELELATAVNPISYLDLPSELDYRWIAGETCNPPFDCLTPLERKLLVMLAVDNMTQEKIGKELGYHFSSVKRKKQEIMNKLRTRMEEMEPQCS